MDSNTVLPGTEPSFRAGLPVDQTNDNVANMANILHNSKSKEFEDLRDRAAYVYVTGTFPTHLRKYFTAILQGITRYSRSPVSLDRRIGSMQLTEDMIVQLGLTDHPMVRKAKHFIDQGYQIQVGFSMKARRPFGKVQMFKNTKAGVSERVTVQADGSVNEGWT